MSMLLLRTICINWEGEDGERGCISDDVLVITVAMAAALKVV